MAFSGHVAQVGGVSGTHKKATPVWPYNFARFFLMLRWNSHPVVIEDEIKVVEGEGVGASGIMQIETGY